MLQHCFHRKRVPRHQHGAHPIGGVFAAPRRNRRAVLPPVIPLRGEDAPHRFSLLPSQHSRPEGQKQADVGREQVGGEGNKAVFGSEAADFHRIQAAVNVGGSGDAAPFKPRNFTAAQGFGDGAAASVQPAQDDFRGTDFAVFWENVDERAHRWAERGVQFQRLVAAAFAQNGVLVPLVRSKIAVKHSAAARIPHFLDGFVQAPFAGRHFARQRFFRLSGNLLQAGDGAVEEGVERGAFYRGEIPADRFLPPRGKRRRVGKPHLERVRPFGEAIAVSVAEVEPRLNKAEQGLVEARQVGGGIAVGAVRQFHQQRRGEVAAFCRPRPPRDEAVLVLGGEEGVHP